MFFETADGGDMDALLGMLAPDVVVHGGRSLGASLRLDSVNGRAP